MTEEQSEEEKEFFAALERELLTDHVKVGVNFQGDGFGFWIVGTVEQCRLMLEAGKHEIERLAAEVVQ